MARSFGNIRQLPSGKLQARYRDADGHPHTAGTFDTRKSADSALAAVQTDMARGTWTDPSRSAVTFAAFAEDVFPTFEWKRSTREQHERALRRDLLPTFGALPMSKVTRQKVDRWWAEQGQRGHLPARRASYMLLSKLMRTAVAYDILASSPCRVANAGRDVAAPRPSFNVADFAHVVEQLDDRMRLIAWTAFGGHLRLGELVGLRRGDFNAKTGLLTIKRQVQELRGGLHVGTPKSRQPKAVTVLEPARSMLAKYVAGNPMMPHAPLFTLDDGRAITRHYVSKEWTAGRVAAGFPNMRLHDIRHISLTLTAQDGTLREVMARGGHTTASAALRYQHASIERDQVVAAAVGNRLAQELNQLAEVNQLKAVKS
ncbi:tyrosine-type recombinase/integrase [Clavibacter nebraskensis]|uniref:tyrosine-type recombinase/integrase n=1 Tax=Clavibacter nebraskensis TaxID=31963 RepID=UPI002010B9BB|nr:tyrosine-type recombinase/integrase [Clavibacter nebraskensis]UQB14585.1 tyrosine-type recombinase/integrase [Clavibacter nebraskensis]UQB17417.1 tyrosine-type recombinase/integrase [Clavibacter nebraskensis]